MNNLKAAYMTKWSNKTTMAKKTWSFENWTYVAKSSPQENGTEVHILFENWNAFNFTAITLDDVERDKSTLRLVAFSCKCWDMVVQCSFFILLQKQ